MTLEYSRFATFARLLSPSEKTVIRNYRDYQGFRHFKWEAYFRPPVLEQLFFGRGELSLVADLPLLSGNQQKHPTISIDCFAYDLHFQEPQSKLTPTFLPWLTQVFSA
ncbi:MAG: hypothetical protein DSM106950_18615 [Stigonema ocellatum SAG 48.90 = DSM 106950]|nr:hypothetical protein [Stigonema ocellatum SAG 48.90 = DSM 106950]